MFCFHPLICKALRHIIRYFLVHVAPLEGLLKVLVQFIPTRVHRIWSIVALLLDLFLKCIHYGDTHLIMQPQSPILMNHKPWCFAFWHFHPYPH